MVKILEHKIEKIEDDNSIQYIIKVKVQPYIESISFDFIIPEVEKQIQESRTL